MMFTIHPYSLKLRRKRCAPVLTDLEKLPTETSFICNLCGSARPTILAAIDRYGYAARTAICSGCGLIFMADRFTSEGYKEFYFSGAYRKITDAFSGNKVHGSATYTRNLVNFLRGQVTTGGKLLDIGGHTGYVAKQLMQAYGFQATLIDPAPLKTTAVGNPGMEIVTGTIEDFNTEDSYDLIILCRTVEHLNDLKQTLAKIRQLLQPGGLFYCDIQDYLQTCKQEGPPVCVSKIDHLFWLTLETAGPIFKRAGFRVVSTNFTSLAVQPGFLLKKCEPEEEGFPAEKLHALQLNMLDIKNDWAVFGQTPFNMTHRTKQTLKRLAKKIKR